MSKIPVKRDLAADKALCEATSPGDWTYYQRGCHELGYNLDEPPNGPPNGIRGYFREEEDAKFCAEAHQGWPHAIDRARAAEAELERLAKDLAEIRENGDDIRHGLRLVLNGHQIIIQERDTLKGRVDELSDVVGELLDALPDNDARGKPCWDNAWEELTDEEQQFVTETRRKASQSLPTSRPPRGCEKDA